MDFFPQWKLVTDAIFAVPRFGQHFLFQTRGHFLYPVLLIDPWYVLTIDIIKSRRHIDIVLTVVSSSMFWLEHV